MPGDIVPLVVEPVDQRECEAATAAALNDPTTYLFLDTSALVYLFRPHEAARKEFMEWVDNGPLAGRIFIPRRALHEFSRHRLAKDVLHPFGKDLSALDGLLGRLGQWAHLVTDDSRANQNGFKSRTEYLNVVATFSRDVVRAVSVVTAGTNLEEIDADLIPFFNRLALQSNIYEDISYLRDEYTSRAEIRMPPGFEDAKKKGINRLSSANEEVDPNIGANRFGDFAIWEEILDFCDTKEGIRSVVIITQDVKPDWSYTPKKIIDLEGRKRNNEKGPFRVTRPQPMLAHEARVRASVESLHIITIPQLAWLGSKHFSTPLTELARAVQIETSPRDEVETGNASRSTDEDLTATEGEIVEQGVPASGEPIATEAPGGSIQVPVDDISAALGQLPVEALADRLYVRDANGSTEMDAVISKLKTSNWYSQNPATTQGLALLIAESGSSKQTFVFGRNVYQAACGSAGTAIGVLEHLADELAPLPERLANIMYAGILFEIYFNKDSEIRDKPKAGQISYAFAPQDIPRYSPAIQWLLGKIGNARDKFILLPSQERTVLELDVVLNGEGEVSGISFAGKNLTQDLTDDIRAEALPESLRYERLRKQISQYFAIPENQFLLRPGFTEPKKQIGLEFIDWGVHTEVRFPR